MAFTGVTRTEEDPRFFTFTGTGFTPLPYQLTQPWMATSFPFLLVFLLSVCQAEAWIAYTGGRGLH